MTSELLTPAAIESAVCDLSVADLIRTAEMLKHKGQAQLIEALYQEWIEQHSNEPLLYAVLFNHAVVLSDAGKAEAARQALERAIVLNPDFIPAHVNLGRAHERLGKVDLALAAWSTALAKMAPITGSAITHKTMALNQSARVLEAAGQDDDAESMLQQSLELDGQQREVIQHLLALRQRQCEWPVVAPSERASRGLLMRGISPLSVAALTDDPLLHLALASHYNQSDVGMPTSLLSAWPRATEKAGPLRIGYLSSDLREHAVGYLMTKVLGLHDRKQVEVFSYYCGPEARDPLHAHFRATSDHWTDLEHLDDDAACRRIADDGIQILVDLNG